MTFISYQEYARSVVLPSTVNSITVLDLYEIITEGNDENFLIIDVRNPEEYESGHIEGVETNIPVDELEDYVDSLDVYDNIYLYCGHGARSEKACTLLEDNGLDNAWNVEGGISQWREEGLPVELSLDDDMEAFDVVIDGEEDEE